VALFPGIWCSKVFQHDTEARASQRTFFQLTLAPHFLSLAGVVSNVHNRKILCFFFGGGFKLWCYIMGEDLHYVNFSQNRNAHGNGLEFTSLNMWTNMILRMSRILLQGSFF
jgi:hypothetical protein